MFFDNELMILKNNIQTEFVHSSRKCPKPKDKYWFLKNKSLLSRQCSIQIFRYTPIKNFLNKYKLFTEINRVFVDE